MRSPVESINKVAAACFFDLYTYLEIANINLNEKILNRVEFIEREDP
jgi:hypothetical protein